ncbi:MAG: hypothetical protein ACREBF_01575 [Candidatus Micrarchaeales archaeon]
MNNDTFKQLARGSNSIQIDDSKQIRMVHYNILIINPEKAAYYREELVKMLKDSRLGNKLEKKAMKVPDVMKSLNLNEKEEATAYKFMALLAHLQITDLRTPYKTHHGITNETAKELASAIPVHIFGFRPKIIKVSV